MADAKKELAAEWVPRTSLNPWGRNPRKNDPAVRRVADSIRAYGWGAPIVARLADRRIIAGHTRWKAAEVLGAEMVPCRFVDVSESVADQMALADNKLGEIAGWDDAELLKILQEFTAEEVALAGFSLEDLDKLLEETSPKTLAEDVEPQVDNAEELRQKWGVERGQIWALGEHRILCGDALAENPWGQSDLVFTDPPYDLDAHEQVRIAFGHASSVVISGCGPEYARLASAPGARFWYEVISLRTMPRSMPRWPGPFVMHWQNAFMTKGGDHLFHRRNAQGRFGNGDYFPSVRGPYKCGENEHGHSKPVAWASEIISMCAPVTTVADPFLGSGTTLIACEQLGRRCRAIEIDPGYVAVAIQRWADATGNEPRRLHACEK